MPYVKNMQILQCPSDSHGLCTWKGCVTVTNPTGGNPDQSYGYNDRFSGQKDAKVQRPAEILQIMDNCRNVDANGDDLGCYYDDPRHNDGWNVGYADGHAKWQRGSVGVTGSTYMALPMSMFVPF
jgi:prepilin-type processing-associated H-X9-DG protein